MYSSLSYCAASYSISSVSLSRELLCWNASDSFSINGFRNDTDSWLDFLEGETMGNAFPDGKLLGIGLSLDEGEH